MWSRFLLSLGNVLVSLILGAVALGIGLLYFPDSTLKLFNWAGTINWPARYEETLRRLVDERQIVYMGFVLATRVVVGLLVFLAYKLTRRGSQAELPI